MDILSQFVEECLENFISYNMDTTNNGKHDHLKTLEIHCENRLLKLKDTFWHHITKWAEFLQNTNRKINIIVCAQQGSFKDLFDMSLQEKQSMIKENNVNFNVNSFMCEKCAETGNNRADCYGRSTKLVEREKIDIHFNN